MEQNTTQDGDKVRWSQVALKLNRASVECQTKCAAVRDKTMKHGHFTQEEDQLIMQRVAEWGTRGKGLWPALESEMDRPRSSLKTRYAKLRGEPPIIGGGDAMLNNIANAAVRKIYWTDEMVWFIMIMLFVM